VPGKLIHRHRQRAIGLFYEGHGVIAQGRISKD